MAKTTVTARAGTRMLRSEAADSREQDPARDFCSCSHIMDFTLAGLPFVTVRSITAAGYATGMPLQIRLIATVFRGIFRYRPFQCLPECQNSSSDELFLKP